MIKKYFIALLLIAFFSLAGIAVAETFGRGYGFLFSLMIAPVIFLIRKFDSFRA
ncbi:hypothetical protein [Taibaiella chishuiensis]|uniref:Uncharacterized protein n=1 Tax=Taibaiella chishuiensis TaxID=1434707 RepID=A0A2P8CZ80_9BACT|nr:hypothetical protein [Taibaiella chishuiensis]PSK90282.1 hypothetical protein B0I18_10810 [Taibaiella chishuiensis]